MSWDYATATAYFAGFFDGEGSISITKYNSSPRPKYRLRVSVGNTDWEVVEFLMDYLADYSPHVTTYNNSKKPYYLISFSGHRAVDLLSELEPFIVSKKQQLRLAIDFWNHGKYEVNCRHYRLPDDVMSFREQSYVRMWELNGKYKSSVGKEVK